MLNADMFWGVSLLCFAVWVYYAVRLNALALQRDADSPENTPYWIKKFENISGPGILIYSITMTACAITGSCRWTSPGFPRSTACCSS